MWNRLLLPVLMFGVASATLADDRVPEPTSTQLQEAEKLVKDVYKDDFAKRGIEERRALAQKLLEEGKNNKSDAASEFVLLREAREAAIQVGDVETAMGAIAAMSEAFTINAIEMKVTALESLKMTLHTVDGQDAAAEAAMGVIAEAMQGDNFDAATKVAELAVVFATASKNIAIATEAQARKTDIKAQSNAYLAMKISEEKLKKDPKDPASNYAMGSYLALYKNEWDKGLPLLAQGNDTTFADAAKADVASPVSVPEMMKVADAWYDLATAHPTAKARLLGRAQFWYELIGPNVEGLLKAKVDKRIEQIAAAKEGTIVIGSSVSEATRKVLPTSAEMKKLKELVADMRVNPGARQQEYIQLTQTLQGRLQTYFQQNFQNVQNFSGKTRTASTLKEGDFFALCKADNDIRKATIGAPNFFGGGNFLGNFQGYAEAAKSKEEFANRLAAYEKFNAAEKVVDSMNADNMLYFTIRGFVSRNLQVFPNSAAKHAFCVFLKNKGVKSAAVERYNSSVSKLR